jgi:histone H2A
VYLAGVLEYITKEILDIASDAAREDKKKRIIPRHIELAIRDDADLNELLPHTETVVAGGGVVPRIHGILIPKKQRKKTEKTAGINNDSEYDEEDEAAAELLLNLSK